MAEAADTAPCTVAPLSWHLHSQTSFHSHCNLEVAFCQTDDQGLPNVFVQLYIVLDPRYAFVLAFVSRPGGVTESLVNIEVWMAARTRGAIQSNDARTREHCRQVTTAHRLTA